MSTIYVDYNLIVAAAGVPASADAAKLRDAFFTLNAEGARFALSAWHAYELARSASPGHIEACCDFVEELDPVWMSNGQYIKRKEIAYFLATIKDSTAKTDDLATHAINKLISQMWATYGGPVIVGETFRNTVSELKKTPGALARIDVAAAATPDAILTGRAAVAAGLLPENNHIVDREYFSLLVDPHEPGALDYVLGHTKEMLLKCPAIAVEERISKIRVRETFRPEHGDAADLQHSIVGLAYCECFISNDKMLVEHCRQAVKACGLDRGIYRSPIELLTA